MEDVPEKFTPQDHVDAESIPIETSNVSEQESMPVQQAPNINLTIESGAIHVPRQRDRRLSHLPRNTVAVGMVGVALFSVYSCGKASGTANHDGAPHANASVLHDTVRVEPVVLACSAKVDEFVGVTSIQHYRVSGHDAGAEKFDKALLNRFPLCGDEEKLVSSARVTTRPNGEQFVTAEFPQAEVEDAAPEFLAWQNCASTHHDDSSSKLKKEIATYQAKITKYNTAIAAYDQDPSKHKYPSTVTCDSGAKTDYAHLNILGLEVNTGIAFNPENDAPAMAYTADQLAMALDAITDAQTANGPIQKAEQSLQSDEKTYLQGKYPNATVTITEPKPRTDEQIMQDRLAKLEKDNQGIGNMFQSIIFTRSKTGQIIVTARESDSASATVTMDDQHLSNVDIANLNKTVAKVLTEKPIQAQ